MSKIGSFKNFKLPQLTKVKQPLFDMGKVTPTPFGVLPVGRTYFAKKLPNGMWETCTERDIYDPEYKPFLAIAEKGYAIWDGLTGKPIVCTNREIFKKYKVSPENAEVTSKNQTLNDEGFTDIKNSHFGESIIYAPYIPMFDSPVELKLDVIKSRSFDIKNKFNITLPSKKDKNKKDKAQ